MRAEVRARIEELQKQEENQSCFDCGQSGPTWASVNNGVFLCLSCSRVHSTFGNVVSDIRSVVLDDWLEHDVVAVEAGGEGSGFVVPVLVTSRMKDAHDWPQPLRSPRGCGSF